MERAEDCIQIFDRCDLVRVVKFVDVEAPLIFSSYSSSSVDSIKTFTTEEEEEDEKEDEETRN